MLYWITVTKLFLESPTSAFFEQIAETMDSVSNILWVSAQVGMMDPSSMRDSKNALVAGFARSARAEREHLRSTTLHTRPVLAKTYKQLRVQFVEID